MRAKQTRMNFDETDHAFVVERRQSYPDGDNCVRERATTSPAPTQSCDLITIVSRRCVASDGGHGEECLVGGKMVGPAEKVTHQIRSVAAAAGHEHLVAV